MVNASRFLNAANGQRISRNLKNPAKRKLRMESLEERTLLSATPLSSEEYADLTAKYATFALPETMDDLNVVTLDLSEGDGLAELKAAIKTAEATEESDLIVVRATSDANTLTYADSSDRLTISLDSTHYGALTIVGLGDSPLILDANGQTNVVSIDASNGKINFGSMTFTNGSATNGGGIYARNAKVTIADSFITGNTASYYGGGIYGNNGAWTITDSEISGNTARSYYGGGIYSSSQGSVTLTDSFVTNNTASSGGGIYGSGGTFTITNSEISGNTARDGGGIGSSRTLTNGVTDAGVWKISNSKIFDNTASFSGGGIDGSGTWTITASEIRDNTASSGGGIYGSGSSSTFTITDSEIGGNTASSGGGIYGSGGGAFTITDSFITDNTASSDGGGIYGARGTFTITASEIRGNTAKYDGALNNLSGRGDVTINGSADADLIVATDEAVTVKSGGKSITSVSFAASYTGSVTINGGDGADLILVNRDDVTVNGEGGNDFVVAGAFRGASLDALSWTGDVVDARKWIVAGEFSINNDLRGLTLDGGVGDCDVLYGDLDDATNFEVIIGSDSDVVVVTAGSEEVDSASLVTLNEAIAIANALRDGEKPITIGFAVDSVTLSADLTAIGSSVIIDGGSVYDANGVATGEVRETAVVIDGQGAWTALKFTSGVSEIRDLTIINDRSYSTVDGPNGSLCNLGASLTLSGVVTISKCDCYAIWNEGAIENVGKLTLTDNGWGICNDGGTFKNSGELSIGDSVNKGVWNMGAFENTGTLTVSGNTATTDGGISNAGTIVNNGELIVSDNTDSNGGVSNYTYRGQLTLTSAATAISLKTTGLVSEWSELIAEITTGASEVSEGVTISLKFLYDATKFAAELDSLEVADGWRVETLETLTDDGMTELLLTFTAERALIIEDSAIGRLTFSMIAPLSEDADLLGIVVERAGCYDLNGDDSVDLSDLVLFAGKYGTTESVADFNSDGNVDISDLVKFARHYGSRRETTSAAETTETAETVETAETTGASVTADAWGATPILEIETVLSETVLPETATALTLETVEAKAVATVVPETAPTLVPTGVPTSTMIQDMLFSQIDEEEEDWLTAICSPQDDEKDVIDSLFDN